MKRLFKAQAARVWLTLLVLAAALMLAQTDLLDEAPKRVIEDVRNDGPNAVGMDLITQNYYEELLKEDREPEWWGARGAHSLITRITGEDVRGEGDRATWQSLAVRGGTIDHETGFLEHSLKPNADVIHNDARVVINRWGHRDTDDYDEEPAPGVFRIALIGSSNSFGTGVELEQGFEQLLERKLNESLPGGRSTARYEIINFSVPRYHLLERVYVARHVAPQFQPDLMLIELTMRDMRRALYESLARRVSDGRDLGFDFVREIVRRSHASPTDSELKVEQRLNRFKTELVIGCFQELARVQDEIGVMIVPMAMRLEVDSVHPNLTQMASIAENAGLPVLRVFDAYEGRTAAEMYLADEDFHPTVKGHALLAEEIFTDLLADPRILQRLKSPKPAPDSAAKPTESGWPVEARDNAHATAYPLDNATTITSFGSSRHLIPSLETPMAVDIQQVKDTLREFIITSFLPGEDPANLRDDTPLRSSGILDSLSTLRLVTFVEDTYSIQVSPHDASSQFDRIEDIAELVRRES